MTRTRTTARTRRALAVAGIVGGVVTVGVAARMLGGAADGTLAAMAEVVVVLAGLMMFACGIAYAVFDAWGDVAPPPASTLPPARVVDRAPARRAAPTRRAAP